MFGLSGGAASVGRGEIPGNRLAVKNSIPTFVYLDLKVGPPRGEWHWDWGAERLRPVTGSVDFFVPAWFFRAQGHLRSCECVA